MKLQQVEWFAARRREIAMAQRASDRKRMITDLEKAGDPLARDFEEASERTTAAVRMARDGGDYPLLSGGDVNLYSLFVERAMTLVRPDGMVGLLTPSGIASDKTAARFFKGVATEGRLKALYDFENKKVFFPDVHASFKFCVFIASLSPVEDPAKCAFYIHSVAELDDPERCFPAHGGRFRSRQSEHWHSTDLPLPPRRQTDHGGLRSAASAGRPVIGRGSEGVAGEVFDDVPHDQRLQPVPYARGA